MTLTVAAGQESAARAFVERMSPGARLTYSVGATLKFELPSDEVRGGVGFVWGTFISRRMRGRCGVARGT